ncbi:Eukaryotic translation initiation factor 4B3 [Hirschfeldia incana]|nr:Eukaryotic translation initiation factor 4B3 [Hirschfeldia incana]
MAAAVSSVWAKPGAWALEAEEHDAELQQQQQQSSNQTAPSSDFPSLAAAATTKTKKKKGQTLSLAEFTTYKAPAAAPQSERLTQAELVSLPTGPRERSAEELERSRGFRSYGPREDSSSRWGSSRASEDGERRGGGGFNRDRESGRDSGPSRADETDDWGAGKKAFGGNGFERRERGPLGGDGFERRDRGPGGGFFESQSKADEADSWVSSKPRFVPSTNNEKRGSFESLSRNRDSQFGSDSDTWGRRREESGGAPPSGGGISRPRLVLQPRTLPVAAVEVKPECPVAAVVVERPVIVERPKGANPFGNARPREEVLAEKGQDWKEIDEKLEAVKLKEVAAVIEKADERSTGKIGFGLGNGRKDDRTDGSWRKSSEQSEETAVEEFNKEEPTKEDAGKEEPTKEEANVEETAKEGAGKKEETEGEN